MNQAEPIMEQTDDVNRPIIILHINGIEISARISPQYSERSVSAEWIKPEEWAGRLTCAAHIPAFAAQPSRNYYRNGKIQPKAITGIAYAMSRDFLVFHEFKENGVIHVSRMRDLLASELGTSGPYACLSDESFKEEKSTLRKRLKTGEIDNLQYQSLLKSLVLLKRNCDEAITRAEWRFMEERRTKGLPPLKVDDMKILSEHARSPLPADELWKRYIGKA
jgi:hypothetical protein